MEVSKSILILAIITLLSRLITGKCNKGCLKCNVKDQCNLCDSKNGYFFQHVDCVFQEVLNCMYYEIDGQCIKCN